MSLPSDSTLRRYNELVFRWVATDNWTWSASFPTPEGPSAAAAWLLQLDSVDTAAQLVLNGEAVAQPSNAHRPVKVDVTELLQPAGSGQNNTLHLTISAAPAAAQAAADAYPYTVPAVEQLGGLPNYNFIRKAASDFGWDWGPAFSPSCVIGDVTLTAHSAPFLTGGWRGHVAGRSLSPTHVHTRVGGGRALGAWQLVV